MNKVILIGRLAKEPDLRYTPNGHAACNFTLAVSKFDKEKEADFIQCVCWNKVAENLAKYKVKGEQIAIEGRLEVYSYEKDGQKRWGTHVNANHIEYIGNNGKSACNANDNRCTTNETINDKSFGQTVEFADSDLPF